MNEPPDQTTTPYRARTLSPILPVADMARSVRFYVEVLGFEPALRADEYSVVVRDGASLHLTRADDASVLKACRGHLSIYLEVEEIGPLWAHVAGFRDRYRIRDLFNREYGMREFHICDPDDCLIFVGQKIEPRKPAEPGA